MAEITENTGMTLQKRNKIIFFALNLACVLPLIVKHYSHLGAGIAAGLLLLAFLLTVQWSDAAAPAARDLPLLAFFDVCILLGLFYRGLPLRFSVDKLSDTVARAVKGPCLWIFLAGAALGLLPLKGAVSLWLKGLGRTAAGAALILLLWSNSRLPGLRFVSGAKAFLAFYLLCALAWYALCAAAYAVDRRTLPRSGFLSWLLLAAFCVLCAAEASLVREWMLPLRERLLAASGAGLPLWRAVLAAVVLTGCAAAAYDYRHDRLGPDALTLGALSGGVLLVRALLGRYFPFSWVLPLIFLAGTLFCLQNEARGAKTLRLGGLAYLAAQTAALLLAARLFQRGLWILAVLLVLYGLVFYAAAGKLETPRRQLFRWLMILSCPPALALGYIWRTRYLPATCLLLAAAYVVLAFAIIILRWPHPGGRRPPEGCLWAVCGAMAALCLLAASRYGADARIAFQPEKGAVRLELAARGRDNEIASAVCRWTNFAGDPSGAEKPVSSGETELPIQGEKLVVVVTDAHGAVSTFTDWCPGWLIEGG